MREIIIVTLGIILFAAGMVTVFHFAERVAPKTVCKERLLVERRFGKDYPADEYEDIKGMPTYIGNYCEKIY